MIYDFEGNIIKNDENGVDNVKSHPYYSDNVFDFSKSTQDGKYTISDFIDKYMIPEGKSFCHMQLNSGTGLFERSSAKVVYYDKNKNAISTVNSAETIELTGDAEYCKVHMYYYAPELVEKRLMIVDIDIAELLNNKPQKAFIPFEKYGDTSGDSAIVLSRRAETRASSSIPDILYKKTVIGFGDSIMYGLGSTKQGFIQLISDKHDMYFWNYGVSGRTMPGIATNDLHNYESHIQKNIPDYILLCGQINDAIEIHRGNEELGQITTFFAENEENTWDVTTFAGAFEKILYTLSTNFPYAKIIHVLEHKMSPVALEKQEIVYSMAKSICSKWNIPTADIWSRLDMRDYTQHRELFTHNNGRNTGIEDWDEKVSLASEMTDITKIYLYVGNEVGYSNNYEYQYKDGSWQAVAYIDGTHPNEKGYMRFYVPLIEEAMLYK